MSEQRSPENDAGPSEAILGLLMAHSFDFSQVMIERDEGGKAIGYTLGCSCGEFRWKPVNGDDAESPHLRHVAEVIARHTTVIPPASTEEA